MSSRPPQSAFWDFRGRRDQYLKCVIPMCNADASEMYRVPLCQMHLLAAWALVEEARQQGANPAAELEEEFDAEDRAYQASRPIQHGWIYYLRIDQYLKIGYTKNIYNRICQYPPNAELLATHAGTMDDEKALHQRFRAYRDAGREWYTDQPEIRAHIAEMLEQHGKPDVPARRTGRPRQAVKVPNGAYKL